MSNLHLRILALTSVLCATQLHALDAPTLQNTVERYDPGKAATEISETDLEKSVDTPQNILKIKTPAPASDAESAQNIKFLVRKIVLVGNTKFSTPELTRLYQAKLNTELSLNDLEQIAHTITEHYRTAGYILSQALIPPQEIGRDGNVKIRIIEGYVNKVSVTGSKSASVERALKAYGANVTKNAPLKLETLERFAYLANDMPGANVRVVLTKSPDYLGAADLTFIVEEQPLTGSLAYNDYNTEVLGRQQLIGRVAVNNLFFASETALNAVVSRNSNRMRYFAFAHQQQLNSNGVGGRIFASQIRTDPNMGSIGLGGLDIPGQAFILNLALDYAWIRSHNKNLYVGTGFKLLNSTTTFGDETLYKDNIRSLNVNLQYDYDHSLLTHNTIAVTFTQGLKVFDAQGNPPTRVGEDLSFSKVELSGSSTHRFVKTSFRSMLSFKAQYAFNILPSSETFTYGGVPFGYGYDPSEFTGDRGIAGLAELQYPTYKIPSKKLFSQVFGFFDFGYVWDINKNIQPVSQSACSTGLGHRVTAFNHVHLDFIVAAPLKRSDIEGVPGYVRLLFNVRIFA